MARREFEMTAEDLAEFYEASKPVPYFSVDGVHWPESPQERSNRLWERLGARLGFEPYSVQPIPGKGERYFTAEALEPARPR